MTTDCQTATRWPTTRILFVLAGTMTLLSTALAVAMSPWWLMLTGFVGANQLLYVVAGFCPASLVIERVRAATTLAATAEEDTCSSTTTR